MKSFTFEHGLQTVINHFEKISKKIEKITKKPYYYVIGIVKEEWETKYNSTKFPFELYPQMYTKRITYQVNYDDTLYSKGYKFVGFIDHTETPEFVYSVEDCDINLHERIQELKKFKCVGCKKTIARNKAFLVEKDDVVEVVGSTCVKDYTGIDPNQFSNFARFMGDIDPDMLFDKQMKVPFEVRTETFILLAAYCIRNGGYKKNGESDFSTKNEIEEILNLLEKNQFGIHDQEEIEYVETVFNKIKKLNIDLKVVYDFWLDQEPNNDFIRNIQAILNSPVISTRWYGIAAYIYEGYRRSLNEESEKPVYKQGYSLEEGRQELTIVKCIFEKAFEGEWGMVYVEKYLTDDDHVVTYKGGSPIDSDFDEPVLIKATVKHDEYNGVENNKIQRIKVLSSGKKVEMTLEEYENVKNNL